MRFTVPAILALAPGALARPTEAVEASGTAVCPIGEVFTRCGGCPATCNSSRFEACTLQCRIGCVCLPGLVRGPGGRCILPAQCPKSVPIDIPDLGDGDGIYDGLAGLFGLGGNGGYDADGDDIDIDIDADADGILEGLDDPYNLGGNDGYDADGDDIDIDIDADADGILEGLDDPYNLGGNDGYDADGDDIDINPFPYASIAGVGIDGTGRDNFGDVPVGFFPPAGGY